MGEAVKQPRMMQIAPEFAVNINDPTAQTSVEAMAAVLRAPVPETFTQDMTAAFESGDQTFFNKLNTIAMIVSVGLGGVAAAARMSRGVILEIGPYVGASTIALSLGAADQGRRFFTVEAGGASPHPSRGSDDILRDLKANVAQAGAGDMVTIIEAWAQEACEQLPELLNGEKVGLLFIDADGAVDEHLNYSKHFLHDDCLLVFDDWFSEGKGDRVRAVVEKLVARGAVIPYGVLGDAWFGRLNGIEGIRKLSACQQFTPDIGHAYWSGGVYPPTATDDMESHRSTLMLYEDGHPLGPAHTLHAIIRETGRGAFSHWRGRILFSTSDNSDPRTNGRRYTARFDGLEADLN